MRIEVRVPVLPESVADATVLSWHKKAGDAVKRDENIVDIETDKVVLDVPAPGDGVLTEIIMPEGSTVTSSELIAVIDSEAQASAEPAAAEAPKAAAAAAAPAAAAQDVDLEGLSPAVRKMIKEHSLDPAAITGTGKGGRITKEDVVNHLEKGAAAAPSAPAPAPARAPAPSAPAATISVSSHEDNRPQQRVPMTRLRARIAERLMEAQATTAMLTTFNEINMQPVMELRGRYKEAFEKKHGVKLGFMSFFVKAATQALQRFPMVNASIDGNDIVYHGFYDVGIAVSAPRGLVVPILRDADQKSYAEIEGTILEFGKKAKEGTLSMDDLTGGTFTISNGGVFGSLMSTPILNPPQSAILGMHKTMERPVVENGQVVVRPMMYLALTYDHRIIDGREAVQFLVAIKDALEDPARLLLDI